jgi:hypothetical protein
MFIPSISNAAWRAINISSDRGDYFYLEDTLTTRIADIVETVELIDWKANRYEGTESTVLRKEYDCRVGKQRTLEMISFSGEFGTGEITRSEIDPESQWSDVEGAPISKSFMGFACNDEDYFKGLFVDEYVPGCEDNQKGFQANASLQLEVISKMCTCMGEYIFDALGQYGVREMELGIRGLSTTREMSQSLAPNYCANRMDIN